MLAYVDRFEFSIWCAIQNVATTVVALVQSLVELGGDVAELCHREASSTLATLRSTLLASYCRTLVGVDG